MSAVSDNTKKELAIRSIKILDIGYVTALFFLAGYYTAQYYEKAFRHFFGEPSTFASKSNTRLLMEILLQVAVIGMMAYILRNLIEKIPYPLNGMKGYDHMKLKELAGPGLITFFLVIFSFDLQQKIMTVRNRAISSRG
jgi:hypothetical protein